MHRQSLGTLLVPLFLHHIVEALLMCLLLDRRATATHMTQGLGPSISKAVELLEGRFDSLVLLRALERQIDHIVRMQQAQEL